MTIKIQAGQRLQAATDIQGACAHVQNLSWERLLKSAQAELKEVKQRQPNHPAFKYKVFRIKQLQNNIKNYEEKIKGK